VTPGRADVVLSGRRLALALVAIGLLAFVLPPLAAREVQTRRVARATAQVEETARAIARAGVAGLLANPALNDIGVLSGPGDPPTRATDGAWEAARHAELHSYLDPTPPPGPDPWLRALQVNIGAARAGGGIVVLSAGPDGIIETPFAAPGPAALGDDILAPLP
jgi:hypothetical protein